MYIIKLLMLIGVVYGKKIFLFSVLTCLIISCSNSGSMTEEEIVQGKCKLIASQYVENLILRGKVAGGQKLDSEEYPEFLNQFISIMDCNGEKISDLSYIQKVSVINEWKESEIERLTKHFEEYPELAMMTLRKMR